MKLSRAEEELMNYIWERKKAYMKDLLDAYPDPKPASNNYSYTIKTDARETYNYLQNTWKGA